MDNTKFTDEEVDILHNKVKVSNDLATSAITFLIERCKMIDANWPMTLVVMKNLCEMNLEKTLMDDLKYHMSENPDISLDMQESVDIAKESLDTLWETFKGTNTSLKEVQVK